MYLRKLQTDKRARGKRITNPVVDTIEAMGLTVDNLLVVLTAFLFYFSCHFAKSLLPLHIRSLGGNDVMVGWTIATVNAAGLVSKYMTGVLQDGVGSKPFILGSSLCLIGATLSYGFIDSIPLLMVPAIFHGIALGSFGTAASAHVLTGVNSEAERTSALSTFSMAHLTATAIAPGLALTLVSKRSTALIMGWAGLVGVLALVPGLRLEAPAVQKIKRAGAIAAVSEAVRDRQFLGASLLYFMWAVSYGAIYSFLPLYGIQRDITNVGIFFSSFAVVNLAGRLVVGGLVSRLGMGRLINISSVLCAGSMCLLVFLRDPVILAIAGVLYGLGSFPLYPCLAATITGKESRGIGMSIALFMANFQLGQIAGSIGLGSVSLRLGYPAIYGITAMALCVGVLAYNVLAGSSHSTVKEVV